jgi:hypothetical protein
MRVAKLDEMTKGWFVGGFQPTAYSTNACEVAVKHYAASDNEPSHLHRVATEITLILSGRVRMMGREWGAGDIVVLSPGEIADFEAITDCATVVVKVPGALNDKYLV